MHTLRLILSLPVFTRLTTLFNLKSISLGESESIPASPAFVIDNLETLEEMNIRGRETFIEAGGESFNYIPCLNDEDSWVDFLVTASNR